MINQTHTCNADDADIADAGFSLKVVMCVMHLILGVALGLIAIAGAGLYLALA